MQDIIKKELQAAYTGIMWPAMRADFEAQIATWNIKPEFKYRINIRQNRYSFEVYVDRRTKAGQVYWWVDQGTGLEGPNRAPYSIDAKNVPFLQFDVPYQPKSFPPVPLRYDPMSPLQHIKVTHVNHPGIQARKFSDQALAKYKDRSNSKGFYRVTENAYRRAFRKYSKSKG
jgi:hypothetical protein